MPPRLLASGPKPCGGNNFTHCFVCVCKGREVHGKNDKYSNTRHHYTEKMVEINSVCCILPLKKWEMGGLGGQLKDNSSSTDNGCLSVKSLHPFTNPLLHQT